MTRTMAAKAMDSTLARRSNGAAETEMGLEEGWRDRGVVLSDFLVERYELDLAYF